MAFTALNSIRACRGTLENKILTTSNCITLALDVILIAGMSTIGILTLTGKLDLKLPMDLGKIDTKIARIGLFVAGGIALADIITSLMVKKYDFSKGSKNENSQKSPLPINLETARVQHQDEINTTEIVEPSKEQQDHAKSTHSHQIMNELYLGDGLEFMQTSPIDWPLALHPQGFPVPLQMGNLQQFGTIITLCQREALHRIEYEDCSQFFAEHNDEAFQKSFNERGIIWHQVEIDDEADAWDALVRKCTFVGQQPQDVLPSVDQWFEPIFQEMDKGICNQKKVLVHCQAGISRSATLVAAYLINRFNVSAEKAVAFLQKKRPCVQSKFMAGLKDYEQQLQANRA